MALDLIPTDPTTLDLGRTVADCDMYLAQCIAGRETTPSGSIPPMRRLTRIYSTHLALAIISLAGSVAAGQDAGTSNDQAPPRETSPRYLHLATGFDRAILESDTRVEVRREAAGIGFLPAREVGSAALVFVPGGSVDPEAYAPMARAIAERGRLVYIVDAPPVGLFGSGDETTMERAREIVAAAAPARRRVLGGHSRGGAVAVRMVAAEPDQFDGLILLGTTHPRRDDLSKCPLPVTKLVASLDGVARPDAMETSRALLPPETTWITIEGGNHAQFGCYGDQTGDNPATLGREEQQSAVVEAILKALERVESDLPPATP